MEGYNCAQSVLYACCDELGMDKGTALKLSCGFGAGMGRKQEVCGAVSGGIMLIGLKYGRGENEDTALMEETYKKTRALMERFTEKYGTCICRDLLKGCDLSTPEGRKDFLEKDMRRNFCRPVVETVVELVEEIIDTEV